MAYGVKEVMKGNSKDRRRFRREHPEIPFAKVDGRWFKLDTVNRIQLRRQVILLSQTEPRWKFQKQLQWLRDHPEAHYIPTELTLDL